MPSMFDTNPGFLIKEVSKNLKVLEQVQPPSWSPFVKTGMHKERPPQDPDWWYIRSASVLRKIRVKGPIGVSKLRRYYGGKKNNGNAPEHFYKGSGNILRKVLQQLEAAGLAKQVDVQGRKGRIVTAKGMSLLDKSAQSLLVTHPQQPVIPQVKFVEKKEARSHDKIVEQLVRVRQENKPKVEEQSKFKGRRR